MKQMDKKLVVSQNKQKDTRKSESHLSPNIEDEEVDWQDSEDLSNSPSHKKEDLDV